MNFKNITALVVMIGFACCGYSVFASVGRDKIRIMSYNVHHCEGADKKVDYERVANVLKRENPDFVGLQELDYKTTRTEGIDQPKKLASLTAMHVTYAKAIDFRGGSYGVAIFSREKPISVIRKPLPGGEPRVLLLCEFADCWVGTTHLALTEDNRLKAAQIIRSEIGDKQGEKPIFMTGDWNARPNSPTLTEFRKFMRILSSENLGTYSSFINEPAKSECCIDYIAIDDRSAKNLSVSKTYVIADIVTSDHCPIVAVLEKIRK